MKKGEIYEGVVEKMLFPNRGLVTVDGERAEVKNALPGQRVSFRVKKKRQGKCEGLLLSVLSPALCEDKSLACRHSGECGGCLYQAWPYEKQAKIKEGQVRELLAGVCREDFPFSGIIKSPAEEGYRNKMEFSFGDEYKDGPLALGLHRRGSFYDIVSAGGCRIAHEDFSLALEATLEYFSEKAVTYVKKRDHIGYLRHLLVRRSAFTGEMLVALVTSTQTEGLPCAEKELLDGWKEKMLALKTQAMLKGILHIKNNALSDVVKADGMDCLWGRSYIYEKLLGLDFKITPFSFFQTNSAGAEKLYSVVRSYIGDTSDKTVFDLYSGTGTISQIAAAVAKKTIGIEIVEEAVAAARENAAMNGLSNCHFIAGDVLKAVDDIHEKPDIIILDPPRDGVHPKALDKIIAFDAGSIIYVSCKPTSLVRDLEVFFANGYELVKSCCVDMFPGTANVETVVLLSKPSGAKNTIDVKADMDEPDVTSADK